MERAQTMRRWAVPVAIGAAVISVGVGASLVQAGDPDSLPEKTAAELLVDVQNSQIDGMSGTIVTSADLGLPSLGGGDASLTALAGGSHTMRLWYADPGKVRLALLGTLGESDVIRNGADMWTWESETKKATHRTLPEDMAGATLWPPQALAGEPLTPQSAAESALAAISETTEVTTEGTAEVAGRDAYELVLAPKDTASTIGEVRLAVDAETSVPLRTQVFAAGKEEPALEIAFTRINFEVPGDEHFTFVPPEGVIVTEETAPAEGTGPDNGQDSEHAPEGVEVVGAGWTAVVVADLGDLDGIIGGGKDSAEQDGFGSGEGTEGEAAGAQGLLQALPEVSGDWGSGRVFNSTLFNALILDDGRVLVGAVSTDKLIEVAGQ